MLLIREWNEFWFTERSPAPIGLFRIGLGAMFFFWFLLIAPPTLYTWYSERGPFPLSFYHYYKGSTIELSLFGGLSDPHILLAIWALCLVLSILFMIGYFTKPSAFLLFLLYVSFNNRDPLVLNSGDTMLRCCLFIMLLAPCGASCSVDRIIAISRGKDRGGDPAPREMWTQRILQIQIALIYTATVCSKLNGRDWMNGTAVYYPLHMVDLARYPIPGWISNDTVINIMTWGTLVIEASMATLIWNRRLRPYALGAGVLLHSSIEYALNIPLFSMIMITSYLNFVYNDWIALWVTMLTRSFVRYRIEVRLPDGVTPADRWWLVLERLDFLHLMQVNASSREPVESLNVTGRGWQADGPAALQRILFRIPTFWLLAPVILLPGSLKILANLLPQPSLPTSQNHIISSSS
jgi:hypothetical protein